MNNPYKYSLDNKRYQTYNYYLKQRFGQKVYRISIDAGAGCPNRCGEKAVGGCAFCSAGSLPLGRFNGISRNELFKRMEAGRQAVGAKCANGPFIAYFQSGSNTYGDTEAFRLAFESALCFENVVGLCIATRADCIDEKCADMLACLAEKTYLTVELGLQTVHDKTARFCNRAHSYEDFLRGVKLLSERSIGIGVHLINGLPSETHEMMVESARVISHLPIHCVKIHMLFIERGTPIAKMYLNGKFELLSREEYVSIVCDQLELLPENVIIARLTGDSDRKNLIAPEWSLKKLCVLNEIDKELTRRNSWQGIYHK